MKHIAYLFNRRAILFIVLLLLIFSSLACSKKNNKSSAQTLTVGYMSIAECLPLFVANERGFFKEEGLEVKMIQFPGGAQTLEALGAKSVDIGFSNLVSLIFAANAKLDFVCLWGSTQEDPNHILHAVVVPSKSDIKQPMDLAGKTIAIKTFKNIDELLLTDWLEHNGIEQKNVKLVEIPFPRMPAVLNNGDVDAIAVVEPFLTATISAGDRIVGKYYIVDERNSVWITSYCTSKKWAENHLSEIVKFKLAMDKSIKYCREHEPESREILIKYTNLSLELAKRIALPIFNNECPKLEAIDDFVKLMKNRGWFTNQFDPNILLYSK